MKTLALILILIPSVAQAVTIQERCHEEPMVIIKDSNGHYQLTDKKETVCESNPSDWRET